MTVPWRWRSATALALIGLATPLVANLAATERLDRRFDARDGLPVAEVSALAQDSAGFIWIGTYGGLVRYDGAEMRLWGHDTLSTEVRFVVAGTNREVVAGDGRRLFRVVSGGLESVDDAEGRPLTGVVDAGYDRDGALWTIREEKLFRHNPNSHDWVVLEAPALEREQPRQLRRLPDGRLFALTDAAVWEISSPANATKIFEAPRPRQLVTTSDGSLVTFATSEGTLVGWRDGRLLRLYRYQGRPIALARRSDTIWATFDTYMVALRHGQPPEVVDPEHGLVSGGPLLVDREGGLWLGTFRALLHYAEPDVQIWTDADGLAGRGTFFLARSGQTLWIAGFGGVSRLEGPDRRVSVTREVFGPLCPDNRGHLWARGEGPFVRVEAYRSPPAAAMSGCSSTPDGSLWILTTTGLYRKAPELQTFTAIRGVPEQVATGVIRGDSRGLLWIVDGERVCHARVVGLSAGDLVAWSCETVEGVGDIQDIQEVGDDRMWIATRMGVFRRDATSGAWSRIPASSSLASSIVNRLIGSPAGGVWVIGEGAPVRVVDRPDSPDGWEVVERLSMWQGLPSGGVRDVLEDPDGSVWLATIGGLALIPPKVRRASLPAPPVELVGLSIDGRPVAPVDTGGLRHRDNLVELRFAALTYRARGLLRYQVRHREDSPWTDLNEASPTLRYVNLPFGRYQVELRASLDGFTWSASPATFAFEVNRPWYLEAWAIVIFLAAVAGALYAAYRIRVGFLLRMERQRVRIAMDLHDEVGSGVGSIGLLASLAADERTQESRRKSVAAEIADMAAEVGATLADLVWALRARADTLEALAYYLAERAGRLFPAASPAFTTDFPDPWRTVRLSAAVRQNVLMIALEALHNAARHSKATRVVLRFTPVGHQWRLTVSDDGVGLPNGASDEAFQGTGLFSMRRRAQSIGATIVIGANHPAGTVVEVMFDPQARERTAARSQAPARV